MKRTLLLLLFTVLTYSASAQTATLRGRVLSATDSTALAGATVMTPGGSVNTMCDAQGLFSLGKVPRSTRTIQIVFLGYTTAEITVAIKSATLDLGNIYLKENTNQIDAVVVQSEAPMSIQKTDTTQFNAAAFKTTPDADADELLMKMPGVVIQNGRVEAQGEPIRKIYVDGRLFFGTDPMAALKNLPADAIESIQIFDEQSEQSRLIGFDDGNSQKAINIVTKAKDGKSTLFKGEGSGGTDLDDNNRKFRYLTGGNFSRFTPAQRITVTALANNVNTMKFGQNELADEVKVDNNGNLRNQPMGVQRITGIGTNYSAETKKIRFSGNYFYDNNRNELENLSENDYFPDPRGLFQSKHVTNRNNSLTTNHNNRLNFRLEWRINANNTFILSPRINIQKNNRMEQGRSLTLQSKESGLPLDSANRNTTDYLTDNFNYSIAGNATFAHRFPSKKGRSISANLSYNFSNRSQDRLQHDLERASYKKNKQDEYYWAPSSNPIDRLTDQVTTSNLLRLRLTYAEPFAKRHRILFNYVMSRDWGATDKQAYSNRYKKEPEHIPEYSIRDSSQCNSMNRDYSTFGGGFGYAYYSKKYTLNTSVDFQSIRQQREEIEPRPDKRSQSFFDVQPTLTFRYSLEKSRYLKIQYRGRTVLPRIDQMQNYVNNNSPTNVRVGNPDLKEGYQHTLDIFYNGSNVRKSRNLTITINAMTRSNIVANSTEVMPRDTLIYPSAEKTPGTGVMVEEGAFVRRYVNLNGYVAIRTSGTYSMAVKPIRSNVNLSMNYNFIRTPSVYTYLNYANIHSGGVRVGITSNISENVDFNFYSNTVFNYTRNSAKDNVSFLNQNLYYSMSVILPLGFTFNTLATWKYYTSSSSTDFTSSFFLLDVGIGKKVFRHRNGEFRITAFDLLNQNRNLLHYVYDDRVNDVRTNTLGRYILARFSYRFNSMVHGKKRAPKLPAGENFQEIDLKDLKKMSNLPKNSSGKPAKK